MPVCSVASRCVGDLRIPGGLRITGKTVTVSKAYLLSLSRQTNAAMGKPFLAALCNRLSTGNRRAMLDQRTESYLLRLMSKIRSQLLWCSAAERLKYLERLRSTYHRFPCTWKEVVAVPTSELEGTVEDLCEQSAAGVCDSNLDVGIGGDQVREAGGESRFMEAECKGEKPPEWGMLSGNISDRSAQRILSFECISARVETISMTCDAAVGNLSGDVATSTGGAKTGVACGDGERENVLKCDDGEAGDGPLYSKIEVTEENMLSEGEATEGSMSKKEQDRVNERVAAVCEQQPCPIISPDCILAASCAGDLQISGGIRITGQVITTSKGYLYSLSVRKNAHLGQGFVEMLCEHLSRGSLRATLDQRTESRLRLLIGRIHNEVINLHGAGRTVYLESLEKSYWQFPCVWKEADALPTEVREGAVEQLNEEPCNGNATGGRGPDEGRAGQDEEVFIGPDREYCLGSERVMSSGKVYDRYALGKRELGNLPMDEDERMAEASPAICTNKSDVGKIPGGRVSCNDGLKDDLASLKQSVSENTAGSECAERSTSTCIGRAGEVRKEVTAMNGGISVGISEVYPDISADQLSSAVVQDRWDNDWRIPHGFQVNGERVTANKGCLFSLSQRRDARTGEQFLSVLCDHLSRGKARATLDRINQWYIIRIIRQLRNAVFDRDGVQRREYINSLSDQFCTFSCKWVNADATLAGGREEALKKVSVNGDISAGESVNGERAVGTQREQVAVSTDSAESGQSSKPVAGRCFYGVWIPGGISVADNIVTVSKEYLLALAERENAHTGKRFVAAFRKHLSGGNLRAVFDEHTESYLRRVVSNIYHRIRRCDFNDAFVRRLQMKYCQFPCTWVEVDNAEQPAEQASRESNAGETADENTGDPKSEEGPGRSSDPADAGGSLGSGGEETKSCARDSPTKAVRRSQRIRRPRQMFTPAAEGPRRRKWPQYQPRRNLTLTPSLQLRPQKLLEQVIRAKTLADSSLLSVNRDKEQPTTLSSRLDGTSLTRNRARPMCYTGPRKTGTVSAPPGPKAPLLSAAVGVTTPTTHHLHQGTDANRNTATPSDAHASLLSIKRDPDQPPMLSSRLDEVSLSRNRNRPVCYNGPRKTGTVSATPGAKSPLHAAVGATTSTTPHLQQGTSVDCNSATPSDTHLPTIKTEPPDDITVEEPVVTDGSFYQSIKKEPLPVSDAAGNTFNCSFCVYECRGRAELTLHTRCRHPEAIRSGAYPIPYNEPSIPDGGHGQLRCADCGWVFNMECQLIVHSWTHLDAHKSVKEEE